MKMNLDKYKFQEIGEYYLEKSEIKCIYKVKKTERLSMVYLFEVDDEVKYIGKTIQGYIRPLSYHKNDVMITVRNGILNSCKEGQTVKIYARVEALNITIEDLELDLIESMEQALIKKYKPEWNNHIQS